MVGIMNSISRLVSALMLLLCWTAALYAQGTPLITRVGVPEAREKRALSVSVELSKSTGISKILFYYRPFGVNDYKELEMLLAGRTATVTIPEEAMLPPYVEYYIDAQLDGGGKETFPLQNPDASPQRITVKAGDPKDLEVRILSPEPGETVDIDELVVAISFYYASDNVNRPATKIFFDDVDVSQSAVISDDVLLFSPKSSGRQVAVGSHSLRIELYDAQGKLYHSMQSRFSASTAVAIAQEKARLLALIDGQAEFRNEDITSLGTSTSYIRGDVRLNGTYNWLNFGATTHVDNQEDPSRQPQNRFLVFAATNFLSVQFGDAYPKFPSYIVSGKRVRGLTANLQLGFFNVDFTMGQTNRSVEGKRDSTHSYRTASGKADTSAVNSRPVNTLSTSSFDTYEFFTKGTFQQDFVAVRPSFGRGENFQLGFTYMHAKDQEGSIRYGLFPEENLVLGSDLLIAFDDQHIKLESQVSLSESNSDISKAAGSIEDLKTSDPKTYSDITGLPGYSLISSIITINKNLFPTNPVGSGTPGVSYESALSLNYLNNFLRGTIFKRGAGYKSFGNEFLQIDFQGFNVSDRIRMFSNRAFLSVAYEKRNDNTANQKSGTTNFDFLNTSLTVVPGDALPTFTVGYGINNQVGDNKISKYALAASSVLSSSDSTRLATSVTKAIDNATSQLYVATNYDFTAGARQSLSLSVSSTSRTDNTVYKRDQSNLNVQLSLGTTVTTTLQTTVAYLLSQNENKNLYLTRAGGKDSLVVSNVNYSAASVGAQLRLFDERLRILASVSPTFGVFNRTIGRVGVDYVLAPRHTLEFSFDYIQNSGADDDKIGSLIYRFGF
jgi:hypothetical protein